MVVMTGDAGFLGLHLVDTFLDVGYNFIRLDNLSTDSMKNLHWRSSCWIRIDRCVLFVGLSANANQRQSAITRARQQHPVVLLRKEGPRLCGV